MQFQVWRPMRAAYSVCNLLTSCMLNTFYLHILIEFRRARYLDAIFRCAWSTCSYQDQVKSDPPEKWGRTLFDILVLPGCSSSLFRISNGFKTPEYLWGGSYLFERETANQPRNEHEAPLARLVSSLQAVVDYGPQIMEMLAEIK